MEEKRVFTMADKNPWNSPSLPDEESKRFALHSSLIRFIVEKHGGTVETHPVSGTLRLRIPNTERDACVKELQQVVGPIQP